jgi:NADP-reducing hydrogenase subunit HndD
MVAALHRLGFDRVFDDCFAADICVMEEATEFMERLKKGGRFLSLLPAVQVGFFSAKSFIPQLVDNLSEVKSPQQIFGAWTKTYYAQQAGIRPL